MALAKKLFKDPPSNPEDVKDEKTAERIRRRDDFNAAKDRGWAYLHRSIRDAFASTAKLLEVLDDKYGVNLSLSALDQNVSEIRTGRGLLQNPALLGLVCNEVSVDLDRVFAVKPTGGQSVELTQSSVVKLAQALRNAEIEARQKPTAGKLPSRWGRILQEICVNYQDLRTGTFFPNAWPTPEDFDSRCLAKFPGLRELSTTTGFDKLVDAVLARLRGNHRRPAYLLLLAGFAGMGILQSMRLYSQPANRGRYRGILYEVRLVDLDQSSFESAHADLEKDIVELIGDAAQHSKNLEDNHVGLVQGLIDNFKTIWGRFMLDIEIQVLKGDEQPQTKGLARLAKYGTQRQEVQHAEGECFTMRADSAFLQVIEDSRRQIGQIREWLQG